MIRVGFGVTALAKAQAGGAHDGISHYTQELFSRLQPRSNLTCVPFSFGMALPALGHTLASPDLQARPQVQPQVLKPYPAAAAWSVLGGQNYLGIDRLASRALHPPSAPLQAVLRGQQASGVAPTWVPVGSRL